jgi:hypothetical protein
MPTKLTRRQFIASASAAVLLLALPSLAFAEDDAAAFAKSLYELPNLWSDVTADDAAIAKYLDPNLGALVRENYSKDDFENALDYDPLIQAQDFETVKATFDIEQQTETRAVVVATVENFGEISVVTLDLTKTTDGWRLSDVVVADGSSLVAELKELNAALPSE